MLPLSSGHARRAAPPAIYGRRAGVRCARIYAWGSGDLRDQAADGRRSRYSPLTPYLTLPYLTLLAVHARRRRITLRQTFAKVFPKVRHTFETKVEETFAKVRSCFRRKTKVASRKTKVASRVWFKSQIWSKTGRNSDFLRRSGAFEAEKHHPARA